MGFWDEYDSGTGKKIETSSNGTKYIDSRDDNEGGGVGGFISEQPIVAVIILVIIVTAIILAINNVKKYILSDTAIHNKQFYVKISKKPAWRLMNVAYCIVIGFAILMTFLVTDGTHSLGAYSIVIVILAYPVYLVLRRIVAYIFNADKK